MKNRVVLLLALVAVGCKPPAVHPVTPASSHRMAALGGTTNASAVNFDPQQTAITATPGALAVQNILGTLKQVNDQGVVTTIGGGGGGTVTTSGPVSGDGSVGTPITIASGGLGTGLGLSAGTIVNTAPFGADTIIKINNSAASPVNAWEGTSTLTTNTAGSEASKYVVQLLIGGVPTAALAILPGQIQGSNGSLGTPAYSFPGLTNTGMWWDNTNTRLAFSFNGGSGGSPSMYIGSSGLVLETPSASAPTISLHGDGGNTIARTAGGAMAIQSTGGVTVGIGASQAIGITTTRNVSLGVSAPATTATAGFPCVPAGAGAPTGAVTPPTGFAAIYVDSTNHKLYHNDGSGWIAAD